jgi:hypothetical protein
MAVEDTMCVSLYIKRGGKQINVTIGLSVPFCVFINKVFT